MGTRALLRKFFVYFLPLSQLHRSKFGLCSLWSEFTEKEPYFIIFCFVIAPFLLKIHHEPKIPIFIYIFFPYNTLFFVILSRYTTRQLEG